MGTERLANMNKHAMAEWRARQAENARTHYLWALNESAEAARQAAVELETEEKKNDK